MTHLARQFEKQMIPSGPGKVVDIKKYLAQTQDNPKVALKNGVGFLNITSKGAFINDVTQI